MRINRIGTRLLECSLRPAADRSSSLPVGISAHEYRTQPSSQQTIESRLKQIGIMQIPIMIPGWPKTHLREFCKIRFACNEPYKTQCKLTELGLGYWNVPRDRRRTYHRVFPRHRIVKHSGRRTFPWAPDPGNTTFTMRKPI